MVGDARRVPQEFIQDIMTRPSSSLGEGTIVVRAAMIGAAQGGVCGAPAGRLVSDGEGKAWSWA